MATPGFEGQITSILQSAEEATPTTSGNTGIETLTITSTDTRPLTEDITYTSISTLPNSLLSTSTQVTAVHSTRATTLSHTGPALAAETSNNSTATTSPQSGLTTGAKAGIGVAVPIGVILILIALWLLRRHKRRSSAVDKQVPSAVVPETSLPEIDGNALNEVDGQSAVPPNRVYELGGNSIRRRPSDRPLLVASEKNKSESKEEKTGSKTQEVVEMRASADYERKQTGPTRVAEAGNVTPLPLDATRETFIPESGSRPYDEMGLDDLEEEMARLRRKKERLQHLQSLEEQEEELRRQIGARRMNI